jgi:hypothetical protein
MGEGIYFLLIGLFLIVGSGYTSLFLTFTSVKKAIELA